MTDVLIHRTHRTQTQGFDDHLYAKGQARNRPPPGPMASLLPLLLPPLLSVLSGLGWCPLTSASIFQLEPSFKSLLTSPPANKLADSSGWKQFPPPAEHPPLFMLLLLQPSRLPFASNKYFCLCLMSPIGRELLES